MQNYLSPIAGFLPILHLPTVSAQIELWDFLTTHIDNFQPNFWTYFFPKLISVSPKSASWLCNGEWRSVCADTVIHLATSISLYVLSLFRLCLCFTLWTEIIIFVIFSIHDLFIPDPMFIIFDPEVLKLYFRQRKSLNVAKIRILVFFGL